MSIPAKAVRCRRSQAWGEQCGSLETANLADRNCRPTPLPATVYQSTAMRLSRQCARDRSPSGPRPRNRARSETRARSLATRPHLVGQKRRSCGTLLGATGEMILPAGLVESLASKAFAALENAKLMGAYLAVFP